MSTQTDIKPNGYVSALTIITVWSLIIFSIYLSLTFANHLYFLAVLIIGTAQRYLEELSHQAIHRNLFLHASWNDKLDLFYAIPLFYTVKGTRSEHYVHHTHLEAEQEKDNYSYDHLGIYGKWLPYPWYRAFVLFIQPFIGIQSLIELKYIIQNSKKYFFSCYIYHLIAIAVLFYFHQEKWYFYYWLIPFFTVYSVFYYYAELFTHFGCRDTYLSRDTLHWFANFFIGPLGFCQYHSLHHVSPKTPWFRYKKFGNAYERNAQDLKQTFCSMFALSSNAPQMRIKSRK